MAFRRVARADEIPPGHSRTFVVNAPVALANQDGRIYALYGLCPHRRRPLEGGRVWGNILTCPWHNFQYDIRTGENRSPSNVYPEDGPYLREQLRPLATYRVEVRDGDVWVDFE